MSGAVRHVSKEYVETNGDEHVDAVNAVGTGPFRFVEHIPDVGFKWTRYDGYHKDRDAVSGPRLAWYKDLDVQIRPEPLAQIAGIEAGEIDALFNLPTDVVSPSTTTTVSRCSTVRPATPRTTSCSTRMTRWPRSTA